MTTAEIKALPKEFDFKSNINRMGLTYHAVEKEHCYVVTHNDSEWVYDKKEFRRYLLNNDFVVIQNTLFEAIKGMSLEEMAEKAVYTLNTLGYNNIPVSLLDMTCHKTKEDVIEHNKKLLASEIKGELK